MIISVIRGGDDVNERIKKLRKALGLTQEKFAERLGIKRNTVATYEIGRNEPIDAVISLICREYGVNEVWLRTGEGGDENMFTKIDEDDRYSLNLGKLSITENQTVRNMVNVIAEASPEKLKYIEDFMKACLGLK
mgnify:CR=1 FL=1